MHVDLTDVGCVCFFITFLRLTYVTIKITLCIQGLEVQGRLGMQKNRRQYLSKSNISDINSLVGISFLYHYKYILSPLQVFMNGESPDSEHQFVNHNVISCVEIEPQYSALQDEAK